MFGVGETEDQAMDALRELRKVDVDVVTFGQYMQPTKKYMKVDHYVEPAEFDCWKQIAGDMDLYVASGPLVRTSYKSLDLMGPEVRRWSATASISRQINRA